MIEALIALQGFVVLFVAVHDWVPLGRLNNLGGIRAADPAWKLALVTALSTLPFAIGLAGTVLRGQAGLTGWLFWWLWISYGAAVYGALRAWWVPYLLAPDPERAERYRTRFAGTLAFLPERNGMRPDALHVALHVALLAIIALLALETFAGAPMPA
jgi:hypothetical protein